MKSLTIAAALLAVLTTVSTQAAPALKDCERIMQQKARQYTLATNVQAKVSRVTNYASLCSHGKNDAIPMMARVMAEKRAVRGNSCWNANDEAWFQRLLVIQKNGIRAIAAVCVAARSNPNGVVQLSYYNYPRRIFAIRD